MVARGIAAGGETPFFSLAEFSGKVSGREWENARFKLEGSIRSISKDRRLIAIQDASGCLILESDGVPSDARVGQGVTVQGMGCLLVGGHSKITVFPGKLVLNLDGLHPMESRSRSVPLEAGLEPFRLDWFNGPGRAGLSLEYEGPGISRAPVPASSFLHASESGELVPGLSYQTFLSDALDSVDDLANLKVVGAGVTPGLDLGIRPRSDGVGISFRGYLHVPQAGIYTFHLGSDDGSRLAIGKGRAMFKVLTDLPAPPAPQAWVEPISRGTSAWVNASGIVTFASSRPGGLELEIVGERSTCQVMVFDSGKLAPSKLLRKKITLEGMGTPEGITVIDAKDLVVEEGGAGKIDPLTQAIQVRRLQPEEANRPYPVRIRGVVTMSTAANNLVIQDASGGAFVWHRPPDSGRRPQPGESWEIEGMTSRGHFSPMIVDAKISYLGQAPMPEAKRPSWDELVNGSVDAEFVEIEGLVVSASTSVMEIQTRHGRITIRDFGSYPLPTRWLSDQELAGLPGSVVRVRGVFKAEWDSASRVITGSILLGNASMSIDDPSPQDSFAGPATPVSDLLLFTSHAGPFKRVKVVGQVLHLSQSLLFMTDGTKGFRVTCRDAPDLTAGDQVEVAGFPRLGGLIPEVVEAEVRKVGGVPLPEPVELTEERLPDARLDATRVKIEATLLNDLVRKDERILEVQVETMRFIVRLTSAQANPLPIRSGSLIELVGTYAASSSASPTGDVKGFELLINSPADLVILREGPWWTRRHTIAAFGLLSGGMLIAGCWVLLLRRTVRLRSLELAREIEERQTVERHRELEQERSRVAHDLHDELGSALTEVGMLASVMRSTAVPEQKRTGYLDRLVEVSRGLVTALDEIVWAVNPRYDSVAGLAEYFSLFAQRFLDPSGIRCRPKISESVVEHPLNSNQRHGVFLAFKEALNNIARHSQASEVLLSIDVVEDSLRVRLCDNGCGFDVAVNPSSGSDGLVSMTDRMAKLGGRCDISATKGEGTTVELRLPLERIRS